MHCMWEMSSLHSQSAVSAFPPYRPKKGLSTTCNIDAQQQIPVNGNSLYVYVHMEHLIQTCTLNIIIIINIILE